MTNNVTAPMTALSSAIDRLGEQALHWGARRTIDEGLDIVRDYCWAGSCALYDARQGRIELIGHRPALDMGERLVAPPDWFPWGLAPMNPRRFMFIEDAGRLPAVPDGSVTLAERGIESCLHLPLLERDTPVGYLQVFWPETRLVWDDNIGRILRTLGRFLLEAAARDT